MRHSSPIPSALQEAGGLEEYSSSPGRERVTVIIPTKNRSADLAVTVQTLLQQTIPVYELIIVDQSAGNEGRTMVESLIASTGVEWREALQLCFIHNPEISGLAAARNRAMAVAEGDIWLFLDDDVELESDFIEQILAAYRRYPDLAGVSGIVTNYARPSRGFCWWNCLFVRGPFHDERQPIYWRAEALRCSDPLAVRRFGGGLMSFRASRIVGLRFDENLRGVSDGEDVDFCAKLGLERGRLMIAPRARLVHKQSPVGRLQDHWARRHARASVFLFEKHWNRRLTDRFWFFWLIFGYGAAVTFASVHRLSIAPWRGLLRGIEEGREAANRLPRGFAAP